MDLLYSLLLIVATTAKNVHQAPVVPDENSALGSAIEGGATPTHLAAPEANHRRMGLNTQANIVIHSGHGLQESSDFEDNHQVSLALNSTSHARRLTQSPPPATCGCSRLSPRSGHDWYERSGNCGSAVGMHCRNAASGSCSCCCGSGFGCQSGAAGGQWWNPCAAPARTLALPKQKPKECWGSPALPSLNSPALPAGGNQCADDTYRGTFSSATVGYDWPYVVPHPVIGIYMEWQCQTWSECQTLECQSFYQNHKNKGLEKNYCRDPGRTGTPWCFILNHPAVSWGYCNSIPTCKPLDCDNWVDNFAAYAHKVIKARAPSQLTEPIESSPSRNLIGSEPIQFPAAEPVLTLTLTNGCGAGGCDVCEGDCDNNAECKSGLTCFHRHGFETVPGCSGNGVSGWDYCAQPELTKGILQNNEGNGCFNEKCDVCEGDCDRDADCKSGLTCFQRSGSETVPGCSGDGVSGWDYCTLTLTTGANGANGCGAGGCDVCEGDCDNNAECKSGLTCFHRHGFETVPGCSGNGVSGWDYCAQPELTKGILQNNEGYGCFNEKCDVCEGDCDSDADCKSGLTCFQRSGSETVPGCSGNGVSGWDYCTLTLTTGANGWHGCGAGKCDVCQGDCDSDADCKSGLTCFQRDWFTPVPGCSGDGAAFFDYCVVPELTTGANGANGCGAGKCDVCQGDCDSDADCKSGLTCFQRDWFTPVPGCSGDGAAFFDYCVKMG